MESISDAEFRGRRRALGGRAQDRLRRKGREYVPHEHVWGTAAARRRRQMARQGVLGCAACLEPTPAARLLRIGDGQLICHECAIAAGVPIVPLPDVDSPVDHELHAWEGEGGAAPPLEP